MSEKIATVTYGKYSKEEWNKLTAKWSDPAFITQRHKLLGVQTDEKKGLPKKSVTSVKNKKPFRLPFPTYAQQMETLNGIGQMLNSFRGSNPCKL